MSLAFVVTVPAPEAELAADALWSLGVVAVEERTGPDATLVELWTSLGDDAETVAHAAEAFPARWRWRLVEVDESVADTWKLHATPSWIADDLVVCPAWIELEVADGTTVIRIDPGAAFGIGDHPTTVLCLRALRESLFAGAAVLDVGCGSGILSAAAAMLGASAVDAIDISAAAVAATRDNAERNAVAPLVHASTAPLREVDAVYDVVLANILAPTILELADDLRRVLGPSGVLIVSGVLADRHDHVDAALAPLHRVGRDVRDGWAVLTYRW